MFHLRLVSPNSTRKIRLILNIVMMLIVILENQVENITRRTHGTHKHIYKPTKTQPYLSDLVLQ